MGTQTTSVTRPQESQLFTDLDKDSYTPMTILSMVELSRCHRVCGGLADGKSSRDTCIAIAGLTTNGTVAVKKYCIPRAMGEGVRGEQSEDWYVWYSDEWSQTIIDVRFTDTLFGDSIIVHRDNRGR